MVTQVLITVGLFFTVNIVRADSPVELDSLTDGIRFVTGLSWNQILSKAKQERKYIFVDCYASWCAPCRKMDKEVYSRRDVGDRFNDKFICVKAQLDSSKSDDSATRAFYPGAHYIGVQYGIQLYPTLIFFNPDGNILNKVTGAIEAKDLVKFANDAQDPQKNYYTLFENYKKGRRNLNEMGYLARTAETLLGDSVQSEAIARDYMFALKRDDWFARENIGFMREFTHSSKDPGFGFFYRNTDSINNIMKDEDYSQSIVQNILYKEIITPEIVKCNRLKTTPDWQLMASMIARKYDQYYADRTIIGARSDWNGRRKDWQGHTKYLVLYVERFALKSDSGGQLEALYFNNCAWDIFMHSTDTNELNTALKWSIRAVMMDPTPGWMDTYANILYKLKRKDAALKWEAIAATLGHGDKAIVSNFESMKEDKPTWPPQ